MQVDVEDLLLEKCLKLIEKKLEWGSSELWTNHDFEVLRERIEEATKVNLSVATLKRIWGKIKYTSKPTITTLDTLVQFIGFENWRVFRIKNGEIHTQPVKRFGGVKNNGVPTPLPPERKLTTKPSLAFLPIVVAVLSGCAVLFFIFTIKERNAASSLTDTHFSFSSKKVVSEGVPNSVIFEYDATTARDTDSVYIQQSWDTRLRQRVDKNAHNSTSIYYYPGFFQAKLVINNTVVKEHNLFIRTNGWLPLIERNQVPIYFQATEVISNGAMTLPVEKIVEHGVAIQPEPPWIGFYNARTFDDLMSDNFKFETEVKNDYNIGGGICQLTEIHIRLEGGLLMIPLSIKGCVSNLSIVDTDGKKPDPSALGCDFSDWVNVRIEVKNKRGELYINNKKAYDLNYDLTPVKVVGLLFRFQGTGSINFVKVSTIHDQVVYEETF